MIKNQRGFTLLEFVFTVLILGLLALFAAPAFHKLMVKERMNSDLYRIYSSIQEAQEIAALSARPVIIIPDPNRSTVTYPDSGNKKEKQVKKRAYWGQEFIMTGYIPEKLYYSDEYDLSKVDGAKKFLDQLKTEWKSNEEYILRSQEYITFASPEDEGKNLSKYWSGFRRFEVITSDDGDYHPSHVEFEGLEGRAIVIDPSGMIVSGLRFNFYHESAVESAPSLQATVGLCLPLYKNPNPQSGSFTPVGYVNNFIPYLRQYSAGEGDDERVGFCSEKY